VIPNSFVLEATWRLTLLLQKSLGTHLTRARVVGRECGDDWRDCEGILRDWLMESRRACIASELTYGPHRQET